MKGIILAGGLGTRLYPLTKITNKHLLPVYDRPMILYALETLKNSGIREILIVCGREHAGHFMNFLGSGKAQGVKLSYALQEKDNGGIADALNCAEDFIAGDSMAVILGDNIFEDSFEREIKEFTSGAVIFLKKVPDPQRFGVVVFNEDKTKIIKIEEKPKKPKSPFVQTGFYLFDNDVFSLIRTLKPSKRGELEIAEVTESYLRKSKLDFRFIRKNWSDAGTIDSLFDISAYMARKKRKHT